MMVVIITTVVTIMIIVMTITMTTARMMMMMVTMTRTTRMMMMMIMMMMLMMMMQEDTHRGVARELVAHVVSRGGRLRLADIAEPGPACGAEVSCAEAVRVGLRLEQWLLETFSAAQEVATKVKRGRCR